MAEADRCESPSVSGLWRAALLTVSDLGSVGKREDTGGDWLAQRLLDLPSQIVLRQLLPDEPDQVSQWIRTTVDQLRPAILVCTGGTGLHPRDRTPEAVLSVGDFEIPGFGEVMRRAGMEHTPHAMLSRQVAVAVGSTLVLALPGALRATQESLEAVWPALPHALEMIAGLPQASSEAGHRGARSPTVPQ
ncbi:MAG: MogA/MoaB family molybdenum cofactor biosynthesis protein [Candidatus Dormibacteria bacterium]